MIGSSLLTASTLVISSGLTNQTSKNDLHSAVVGHKSMELEMVKAARSPISVRACAL